MKVMVSHAWSLYTWSESWFLGSIKSTQNQNQSSSPWDYREGSHALTMQPANTELKQPPKVTQPACFTQAQKQLKTSLWKRHFPLTPKYSTSHFFICKTLLKTRTKSGSQWSCAKPSIAQTWINPEQHQELHSRPVPSRLAFHTALVSTGSKICPLIPGVTPAIPAQVRQAPGHSSSSPWPLAPQQLIHGLTTKDRRSVTNHEGSCLPAQFPKS